MPIRFRCKRCHQLLGIASRKAGSQIQCPKCGITQVVPNEEAAAAAMAMDRFARTHEAVENTSDLTVYDDDPAVIEAPRPRETSKTAPTPSAPTATTASAHTAELPLPEPGQPIPRGMILYPRRTFYVQGLLFTVLAAVTFVSGYFIGRGDATYQQQLEYEEQAKEKVPLEGKLVYDPGTGQIAGDQGAVIIALPALPGQQTLKDEEKIPFDGIRPQDPPPQTSFKGVRMIGKLGGRYTRAKAEGDFYMLLPDQGKYRLLIISAHVTRSKGSDIEEPDEQDIERYFTMAGPLISHYKYRWTLEEVNVGSNRVEINFSQDEKK